MLIQSLPLFQGAAYPIFMGGFSGGVVGLVLGVAYCANLIRTQNHHPELGCGDLAIRFSQIVMGSTASGIAMGIVAYQIAEIAKNQFNA